ncbi:ATP-binding cassette domain-containing protein [Psychrobium sp. MM17-31]|uniref:ATP-binding cassette domain-containing protein n=1 Tax=Psychrobium sp. MM17-31 TaxID=2917758 RepID=UPI001EF50D3B|nr:ATP-binding cassette domain-containing protein [Psychrobium sp. MM17-31]MCG7533280.1 ATP-binding cassette domain-containing protein [Psychrobium sp. MM17-31]
MLSPALELMHITKYYHDMKALDDVCLRIAPGSIHGVIGENGAGKSTLLKIAYGLLKPERGEVFVDGVKVVIDNPQHAIDSGIGMLHQTTSWLEQRSIIENILLGEQQGFFMSAQKAKARRELEQLCREFGFSFDLDMQISKLDYSQRQLVDVLRSLYRGAKVLILDEPMALLSPVQSNHLLKLLNLLKMQGISILIVAHKLSVLHAICDVISVMGNGKLLCDVNPKEITLGHLSKLMVGREITLPHPNSSISDVETHLRLKVSNLAIKPKSRFGSARQGFSLSNIDMEIHSHEIVALTGLPKAGHEELLEVLAGSAGFTHGRISINGKRVKSENHYNLMQARELSIAYVPDPLAGIGVVKDFPMYESAMLGYHRQSYDCAAHQHESDNRAQCLDLMKQWDIRPANPRLRTGAFSLGNQQKLVLAREVSKHPELLLLAHPSNGLDVGAIESVYQRLFKLRDKGASIIFCSNDLEEIMSLSDRVVLFERGQIIGQYYTQQLNKNELSLMLANEVMSE